MNIYKNPFAIRASERIETDEMFLELFSSEPLSYLEAKNNEGVLWNNMTYILSSPGAGKTTLLRLFSPSILQKVVEKSDVYKKVKKLGVKEGKNIHRCGVYIQMGRDYEFLEDDNLFGVNIQKRVFLSLLNARIVLATLKSLMSLAKIKYTALNEITYFPEEPVVEFGVEKESMSGKELLDWAASLEKQICDFLDSYVVPDSGIKGTNSLFALSAMKASWFTYKGKRLCDEFIFQFDDGHKLSDRQKKIVRSEVAEKRLNVTLWIAERLETLCTADILNDNNFSGRDYQSIRLESSVTRGLFSNMAKRIATLRSGVSYDGIGLLDSLAHNSYLDYSSVYNEAFKRYVSRFESLHNYKNFRTCLSNMKELEPYERALKTRALLMYAARKDSELLLFDYDSEDLDSLLQPFLPLAEEMLPGENTKLPQYYGAQTLIELSSFNIEQFLNLSSLMFDRLVANKIIDPDNYDLSAEDQEIIINKFCIAKLDEIKRLRHGNMIYEFLINVISFCKTETFTDSYSYRSVTGFAVSEENSCNFGKDGFWFQNTNNEKLAMILKDCLAYNLLEKATTTQGKKDQQWSVFYLNRWLCAYAHLPLCRGGWRKIALSKLNKWVESSNN